MFHTYEDLVTRSQHIRPLRILEGHTDWVRSADFSPDGRWLVSGGADGTVYIWEVENFRVISALEGHTQQVLSVAFSPDGRWLASGSYDQTVRLWEVETGRTVRTFEGHTQVVRNVAFSPDGRWLASGSEDASVRLWEAETGRTVKTLEEHTAPAASVAFSPDGHWLASSSEDASARLWEVESGYELRVLIQSNDLSGSMDALAWSPDGELLVFQPDHKTVCLLHATSGQRISILRQAGEQAILKYSDALAISPDGRLLTTYAPDTTNAIQLWDISALDVGPKPIVPSQEPVALTAELQTPLRSQLRTLPLTHVTAKDFSPARAASWLRGAAAAGWPLPLALAHDLGLLLGQPAERLSLAKPAYLPFDEDTSAYLTMVQRFATHPLVRELPQWQPPLSDTVLSIILARLVEGLELSEAYRPPAGPEGVRFVRELGVQIARTDPAQLWRETPLEARPHWRDLLSPAALARLESNLRALDREELRFLTRYGSPLLGSPDPRDLLDLLALTGLPPVVRLALSQTLRLLPHVSEARSVGGLQTYPEGGYEGLAQQGSLDSLLSTEMAYPTDIFLHRVLNQEALYYGRERPREQWRELAYLVGQVGWGLGGDGQVLVRALLLALGQAMRQRGYEVLYSFAGAQLSEPRLLDKPREVGRVLYYQGQAGVNSAMVLQGVLRHLRQWREQYRGRQVLWVVSEHFDADEVEAHAGWYRALQAEAGQQAWYVRVGPGQQEQREVGKVPLTARSFGRWQMLESGRLWAKREAGVR